MHFLYGDHFYYCILQPQHRIIPVMMLLTVYLQTAMDKVFLFFFVFQTGFNPLVIAYVCRIFGNISTIRKNEDTT